MLGVGHFHLFVQSIQKLREESKMNNSQSLTSQLYVEALKRRLESNPERAGELAINVLKDFLEQARLNSALQEENARLRTQLHRQQRPPQLFPLSRI